MILASTYIYRIIHIDNLEYILRTGLITNKFHAMRDPSYVGIGETDLIGKREDQSISTSDLGNEYFPSRDFLPFYFYFQSVMLYRIQKGYKVTKRPPEDIIYLVFKLDEIIGEIEYIFTDGHGYASMSNWFEDIDSLEFLDNEDITRKRWENTEEDPDRRRRKQAEFWIKQPLSIDLMTGIATFNDECNERVNQLVGHYQRTIEVKTKPNFYY